MAKKFLTGLTLVNLDSDPLTGSEGELYFNTSASVAKIYKAGSWTELGAGSGSGNIVTVGSTEPSSPNIGDGWYDNSNGSYYVYDGTYWVEISSVIENPPLSQEEVQDYVSTLFTHNNHQNIDAIYDDINNQIVLSASVSGGGGGGGTGITISGTAPENPLEGDGWYNNDNGSFYLYDGTYWVEVNGIINGITDDQIQDAVAPLFEHSQHTNVTATYDDLNNKIILNTSASITNIDSIVYPDYIAFDTTPETTSASVGTVYWDSGESGLNAQINSNINLTLGQEVYTTVYNGEATTLNKGEVVMVNGASGQRPRVIRAYNTSDAGSARTFGIVAENIASGAEGVVVTQGIVKNINTNGFNEGDILYLSSTPGQLTTIKPTAPNHYVFVGIVLKKNAASGRIYVKPQNGYELDELHNVSNTSLQNDQALVYESSTSLWKNKNIVNSISGTANQISTNSNSGSVTLSLPNELTIPGNMDVVGNLDVFGNLTVSGSTTYLNVQELLVDDNIIVLNHEVSGSPSLNAGIEIERGDESNVSIRWNETSDQWEYTNDGVNFNSISSGVSQTIWQKTISSASVTSLSGLDNNSVQLSYIPGLENVYLNGVKLVRGLDYVATSGSTITNLSEIVPGSIAEVVTYSDFNIADTYTKGELDSLIQKTNIRWTKGISASTSILTGLDNNSINLDYIPNAEQLFINGVLQARNVDYTVPSSGSISLTSPVINGDIVEVLGINSFNVANTYTKSEVDSKLLNYRIVTSSTRPANPYNGLMIYETDTNIVRTWNGSQWIAYHRPGDIIEKVTGPCDGGTQTVVSGTYTFPNVTGQQDMNSTYQDISGSNITYTPPLGATRVVYKFNFSTYWTNASHAISHYRFYIDGVEVVYARHNRSATYQESKYEFSWTIPIGGSPNTNTGRQATWTTPKTLKLMGRSYDGNANDINLHGTYYWDGGGGNVFSMPTLTIEAIA